MLMGKTGKSYISEDVFIMLAFAICCFVHCLQKKANRLFRILLNIYVCVCVCVRVCVCVCVCVHVYVVYEDTNLYNDMGMT